MTEAQKTVITFNASLVAITLSIGALLVLVYVGYVAWQLLRPS